MTELEQLTKLVAELSARHNAFELIVTHVIANEAKKSGNAANWVRTLAESAYGTIDNAPPPPPGVELGMQLARAHIDRVMLAVQKLANE